MFELARCINKDSIEISHDKLPLQRRKKSGNKSYICAFDNCMKSYGTSTHLRRHEETHIGHFQCNEENCGMEFKTRFTLKKHIDNIHLKKHPKKFKCSHCEEQFNKHNWLVRHICKMHTGIQPYECPNEGCGKRFLVPSKLKRHMKMHNGYMCTKENCGKIFPKWTLLNHHKAVSHPTIYKCSECRKEFSIASRLKNHLEIHKLDRKVFQCPKPDCSRFFVKQFNLDHHIQSFHGNPFVCTQKHCHETFKSKAAMINHCSRHDLNKCKRKLFIVGKSLNTKRSDIKYLLRSVKETSYTNLKHLDNVPSSSNQPVNSTNTNEIDSRNNSEKADISAMPVNETETSHGQKNNETSFLFVSDYIPTLSSVKSESNDSITSESNDSIKSESNDSIKSESNDSIKSESNDSINSESDFKRDLRSANTFKLSKLQQSTETSISDECDEITILPTPAKAQPSVIALDDEENSTLSLNSRISPRDVGLRSTSVTRSLPVVPVELPELLHDLSFAVIKNNPDDIVSFAADYFQQLVKEREKEKLTSGFVFKK